MGSKKVNKNSLGDRMKRYETVFKNSLVSRMPVILRLDGVAFHTFTRGFEKPFDEVLVKTMQEVTKYLCENIQGCVFGYTQSDEITLILVDYAKLNTSAWFDNEVQKMCSVAASMCTMKFNELFKKNTGYCLAPLYEDETMTLEELQEMDSLRSKQYNIHRKVDDKAYFDCRAFNVPKEDVCNCILWRQKDAERNSIQALAQHYFSHKELQNKNRNQLQDMLHEEKGVNWNNLPTHLKRGTGVLKKPLASPIPITVTLPNGETVEEYEYMVGGNGEIIKRWVIDAEMPILTQDREYIERLINI